MNHTRQIFLSLLLLPFYAPAQAPAGVDLSLATIIDLAGCKRLTCFEEKVRPLGFRYSETIYRDDKTAYQFLRTVASQGYNITQTISFYDFGGSRSMVSFSTTSRASDHYPDAIRSDAVRCNFREAPNSPERAPDGITYLYTAGDLQLDLVETCKSNGVEVFLVAVTSNGGKEFAAISTGAVATGSASPSGPGTAGVTTASGPTIQQARDLYDRKEYVAALPLFLALAAKGDRDAMFYLGYMYSYGLGVNQNYSESFAWYKKSADKGGTSAMGNLGNMYRDGRGVAKDFSEALRWYRMGAEKNHGASMGGVGDCYFYGRGVEQDYREAAKWYAKGLEKGMDYSRYMLGRLYYEGKGVEPDKERGVSMMRAAASNGNRAAAAYLKENGL